MARIIRTLLPLADLPDTLGAGVEVFTTDDDAGIQHWMGPAGGGAPVLVSGAGGGGGGGLKALLVDIQVDGSFYAHTADGATAGTEEPVSSVTLAGVIPTGYRLLLSSGDARIAVGNGYAITYAQVGADIVFGDFGTGFPPASYFQSHTFIFEPIP